MGAAAENRPVIGRFELEPDEALILEFEPPKGVYWSISLGNPGWRRSTTDAISPASTATRRWSTPTGRRGSCSPRGIPGVANWLDTAGHSNGAMLLRCVRTETAPVPSTRVVKFDEVRSALPADTTMTSPDSAPTSSKRAAAPYTKGSTDDLLRRRT